MSVAAFNPYLSLRQSGSAELIEKKSRFISSACPVATPEQALAFIAQIRAAHPRASHNVWAYTLREDNTARFSDDGEPQGTAGLPTLELMKKMGIVDAVVVTTRYFGGTLLGAAGLLRAYTSAAKMAIDICGILLYDVFCDVLLEVTYSDYQRVSVLLGGYTLRLDNTDFGSSVVMSLLIKADQLETFLAEITEATNGRAELVSTGQRLDYI